MVEELIKRVQNEKKTIVLPESDDERIIKACEKCDFAHIILISKNDIKIKNATIINPLTYDKIDFLIQQFYELRKEKGLTLKEAENIIKNNNLYFACMLVKMGFADGVVCGAKTTSSEVLRAGLQTIKSSANTKLVSSFFLMELENKSYGENGIMIFSDCGLNINPSSDDLVEIAYSSAKSFENLVQKQPQIVMLSHSTYGSSKADSALKMKEATKKFKEKFPQIMIDGEMQVDSALIEKVRKNKAPNSTLNKPNIFIFPNIDAGNIGCKLVERLANAKAYGPITQGLMKPLNDLSRGCSVEDIIAVIAITCIQAK